jgi:hypothetical protein
MNIEYAGFPGFGFPREKTPCNVCICHCIFSILFLNICLQSILYKVRIYIWYQRFIGFRGMPLWSRVWLGTVISFVIMGDL